ALLAVLIVSLPDRSSEGVVARAASTTSGQAGSGEEAGLALLALEADAPAAGPDPAVVADANANAHSGVPAVEVVAVASIDTIAPLRKILEDPEVAQRRARVVQRHREFEQGGASEWGVAMERQFQEFMRTAPY